MRRALSPTWLRRPYGGLVTSAGMALVALLATGCTPAEDDSPGSDGGPAAASPRPTRPTAATPPAADRLDREVAPLQVDVRNVWGRWPGMDARRTDLLARRAGRAVTSWIWRGYVELDYPTSGPADISRAFSTFTPGAADEARRQPELMTNAAVGRDLVQVVPTRQVVRLVGYAPRGAAVGATATVGLVLLGLRDDGGRVEVRVTGELYLTRAPTGQWRVFGYDIQRSNQLAGDRP